MIKGIFYIESQGNRANFVRASLKGLVDKLKNEKKTRVIRDELSELEEEDGIYSAMAEVEAEFEDLTTYLMNAIKYGPSAIEILAPERLVLNAGEFLETVGEVVKTTKLFFSKYNLSFKFEKGEIAIGLSDEEIEGLLDQGAIRAKIVVESKDKSRRRAVNSFVRAVSDDLFINKVKTKKMGEGEGFEGLVGIEAFMYSAKTLVDIAVKHMPVLIEIIEPEEIELSMLDLQDIGVDLAGVFFEASHQIASGSST
jgi:hypothetical protein